MAMLDDDTGLVAIGPGRWHGEITDRWSVRAPNGGYIATYLTRALMNESPFPDPLALNVHYVAPAQPGPAFFEVDVLRVGRSHATMQARLFQGELTAVALATFGRRRTGGRELGNTTMPVVPPPEECGKRLTGLVPGFTTSDLRGGYLVEDGELWGSDGTLVAQSRQLERLVEARG